MNEYRKNVGAILRRSDGKLLMCERIDQPGAWQFPQGGVDEGESLEHALWRELAEELGLAPPQQFCSLVAQGPAVCYDFPADSRARIARRFKGQEQTLFLLDFRGSDDDIHLDADDHPEFRAFRWVTPTEAAELTWEVKRPILDRTLEVLSEHFG